MRRIKDSKTNLKRPVFKITGMKKKLYFFSTLMFTILVTLSTALVVHYIVFMSYKMEAKYAETEIGWFNNLCGDGEWSLQKNGIYKGEKFIGSGKKDDFNAKLMATFSQMTDTQCRVYCKTQDDYVVVASTNTDDVGMSLISSAKSTIENGEIYYKTVKSPSGKLYCVYKPIFNANDEPIGLVCCARNIDDLSKNVFDISLLFIPINIIILAIAIFGISRLVNVYISVIKDITAYLDLIKNGNVPNKRLEYAKDDELNDIIQGVNELADAMDKNARLQNKSETDELTKLGNRFKLNRYFEDVRDSCIRQGNSFAIEIIDVDFFKQFNDNYGHTCGDKCLQGVADILSKAANQRGVYATRYGGDEFVMIYEGYDKEAVHKFERLIHNSVHKMHMRHEYSKVNNIVTVTQGAYFSNNIKGQSLKDLLAKADAVLYKVKEKSKDNFDIGTDHDIS